MCMRAPRMPTPVMPPERAAQRAPDRGASGGGVAQRMTDRMRSMTSTILTSGSGVSMMGDTAKKTLLGE